MSIFDRLLGKKLQTESQQPTQDPLEEACGILSIMVSEDYRQVLERLKKGQRVLDKHFLYLQLIDMAYGRRKDPAMRDLLKRLAIAHIAAFEPIRKKFLQQHDVLPHVPTFQYLATAYAEDGEYEEAIKICEKAIAFGLHDWTKSDYAGRIERIKKKAQKSNQ
jgi:tetratricopeptide (TPR) repeat protein